MKPMFYKHGIDMEGFTKFGKGFSACTISGLSCIHPVPYLAHLDFIKFNQGAVNLPQVDILKGLTNLSKAFSLIVIERFCKNSSMRNLSLPPFLVEPIFCFKIGCPKFNLTDFSNKRIYYIPHAAFNSFTYCIISASPVLSLSG